VAATDVARGNNTLVIPAAGLCQLAEKTFFRSAFSDFFKRRVRHVATAWRRRFITSD
jgi:hypothetical protein